MGVGWSAVGVEGVPLELVYRVLSHVSLRDLTTLMATCTFLRSLVQQSPLLWSHVHTKDLWPQECTWHWFERAAMCGNVGASIKLVVALLYSEGVKLGKSASCNVELVLKLFGGLEGSGAVGSWSQLWILYRPPWGAQLCCKRHVYIRVAHLAQGEGATWAVRVLSRIDEVAPEDWSPPFPQDEGWIRVAARGGDLHARLLQWRSRYERRHREAALDPGTELQACRELRELCHTGYYPACLTLTIFLASSRQMSGMCEVREFLQNSPPSRTWSALSYQRHLTPHMHHVLVDWLCEVANMKFHSSQVLHAATQIVEAYLSVEQVRRNQLQLVGITSILLATRFMAGASLMTVREASWVTDETYSYCHVVRTIGHIMAALKANLSRPTILEYSLVVVECVRAPGLVQEWTCYMCDLAISCTFPPGTTLAQIATSCVLLAYVMAQLQPPNLPAVTGFSLLSLVQPAAIIYYKNFDTESNKCERRGIVERHSMQSFSPSEVGRAPKLPHHQFLAALALVEPHYLYLVAETPLSLDGGSSSGCGGGYNTRLCSPSTPSQGPQSSKAAHPHTSNCNSAAVAGASSGANSCPSSAASTAASYPQQVEGHMECGEAEDHQDHVSEASMETASKATAPNPHGVEQVQQHPTSPGAQSTHQALSPLSDLAGLGEDWAGEGGLESLSETTDSEGGELGPPQAPGSRHPRLSLKRKLEEDVHESERSEKCLILDVGNLQLS